jgi:hypothetical protein
MPSMTLPQQTRSWCCTGDKCTSALQQCQNCGGLTPMLQFVQVSCICCRRGVQSTHFTLILQGRVLIHTGAEDFELELGPWSVLGQRAMVAPRFEPVSRKQSNL